MKKIFILFLFILFGVFIFTASADAATYYVSKSGSDSNSCSQSSPCQTINAGIAKMTGGDMLIVGGGEYNEVIGNLGAPATIPGGISEQQPTTIKAVAGEKVWLRPNFRNEASGAVITYYEANYGVFDGINVDGSLAQPYTTYGVHIQGIHNRVMNAEIRNAQQGLFVGGSHSEFINLNVHATGMDDNGNTLPCYGSELSRGGTPYDGYCHGYYLSGNNHRVDGGAISNANGHGIQFYRRAGGSTLRNVLFTNAGVAVIGGHHDISNNIFVRTSLWLKHGNNVAAHNTFYDSRGNAALYIDKEGSNNTVRDNLFLKSDAVVPISDLANNASYTNNLCDRKSIGCTVTQSSIGNILVNAAGGDFHLTSNSPAKGAASDGGNIGADADKLTFPNRDFSK